MTLSRSLKRGRGILIGLLRHAMEVVLKSHGAGCVASGRGRSQVRRVLVIRGWRFAVLLLAIAAPRQAVAQELYGIVSEPPYAGYVVEIDLQTGDVTRLFPTGIPKPAGLTYDPLRDVLLTIASQSGQVYRIDLKNENASPLLPLGQSGTESKSARGLAYRRHGDLLYALHQDQPGAEHDVVSLVATNGVAIPKSETPEPKTPRSKKSELQRLYGNPGDLDRLAVRLSDEKLFGAGGRLPGPHSCCGDETRITGMDFHPRSGDLYVSYDRTLIVFDISNCEAKAAPANSADRAHTGCANIAAVDPATGKRRPLEPLASDIGALGGIAFVKGPAPDVWMKDCEDDDGTVPSSPNRCEGTLASPDVWIENHVNRRADSPIYGADNWLYARVRNRNEQDAAGTSLAFYYWACPAPGSEKHPTVPVNQSNEKQLVGDCKVDVPAGGTAFARVRWRNLPELPGLNESKGRKDQEHQKGKWCIQAVLDHPDDRVHLAATEAADDNNIAVTDTKALEDKNVRGRPGKRAMLEVEERRVSSYPGELESEKLNGYPIAYAKRPLVMQRGMIRTTTSLGAKKAGLSVNLMAPDQNALLAVDAGFAFAVHRNIEVGVSSYRIGSTPPKTGQGLVSVPFNEEEPAHWGDIPLYARFRFVDRATWQVAADLVLVFPVNTKLASTFGLPIRIEPRDYDLAIDWGIEATLLTNEFRSQYRPPSQAHVQHHE